ncbi:MAG TPA: DUF542 domain-containing protein [Chitinophagaceae bacterium]|nr:DUF542 domain-containing protein [Chitinophagaceae bacterium]
MFPDKKAIRPDSTVSDIVRSNHHTAEIFSKYDIEYCCGGKWPLQTVCMMKGLSFDELEVALQTAGNALRLPPGLAYDSWDTDFLILFLKNIDHRFFLQSFPITLSVVKRFAEGHVKKFPEMQQVWATLLQLQTAVLRQVHHEEETIFPYISQVAHAYDNKDSYAKLLVKTLRKPLETVMKTGTNEVMTPLLALRTLTKDYLAPLNACVSHGVALKRLKDMDDALVQHLYLENEILFPRAISIEKQLLQ